MMPIPRPDGLRWNLVVDGFVSCFQRVPENIRVNLESSSQGG
jgi:hypothetical protein